MATVEKYSILQRFVPESDAFQYFEENYIEYQILGTEHNDGKIFVIHHAYMTAEDVLFLSIKFPDLSIRKISIL